MGIATATWFIRPPRIVKEICEKMQLNSSQKIFILGVDRDSTEGGFYTTDACTQCGICEKICQAGNIHLTDKGVEWGHDCQQCMTCIMWCPQKAVRHPNVPEKRRRYHHPDITLADMIQSGKESK
ncbi:MAG: EFR1 family ferrodoxin [Lachnospiraceae bacterium]|nr:EFR1 family ferrodoxin [Lachnospiraceae bacterium]